MLKTRPLVAIIGAGPKSISILAKAKVLANLGYAVPRFVVFERQEVCAHWTGNSGLTDGMQRLGTPPEKDIGYPYASNAWGKYDRRVDDEMFEYSWYNFLRNFGRYADWIDRGQPSPTHREFAAYLQWVGDRVGLRRVLKLGKVKHLSIVDGKWAVKYQTSNSPTRAARQIDVDALVMTGQGSAQRIQNQLRGRRVLDGKTYWKTENQALISRAGVVAVVGAGETAASVAVDLAQRKGVTRVDIINPLGVLLSRGESHTENHIFTNPRDWQSRPLSQREALIRRADRGVFSMHAQDVLRYCAKLNVLAGRAKMVRMAGIGVKVAIEHATGSRVPDTIRDYDLVVVATGFLPISFLEMMDLKTLAVFADSVKYQGSASAISKCVESRIAFEVKGLLRSTEHAIEADLSVRDLKPKLHLPMVSGVAQGPGFPNLSSLGVVSDRILSSYCRPSSTSRPRRVRSPSRTSV